MVLEAVLEVVLGYTGRQLATAVRIDARTTVARILEVVVDGKNVDLEGIVACACARYPIDTSEEGINPSHKQFDWQHHQQITPWARGVFL